MTLTTDEKIERLREAVECLVNWLSDEIQDDDYWLKRIRELLDWPKPEKQEHDKAIAAWFFEAGMDANHSRESEGVFDRDFSEAWEEYTLRRLKTANPEKPDKLDRRTVERCIDELGKQQIIYDGSKSFDYYIGLQDGLRNGIKVLKLLEDAQ